MRPQPCFPKGMTQHLPVPSQMISEEQTNNGVVLIMKSEDKNRTRQADKKRPWTDIAVTNLHTRVNYL